MQDITAQELKSRIDAGENLHIIDVREPDEYAAFNIGAKLVPLGQVMSMQVDELEDWKEHEVIVHCHAGKRSMQAGLMLYTPNGFSPRHKHDGTATYPEGAVHFYMIFEGTGKVIEDTGTKPIGPGDLVLIPAGEWHQLVAADTGLRYMEFQGPFDFASTMDNDPEGKDWFIKGTDDGAGKLIKWVQS